MIRFLLTALLVVMSVNVQANEDKAALRELLANMTQFKAHFEQRVIDDQQNEVHRASGELFVSRPDKLRWQTREPDSTLLIADGQSVWSVDDFVEQVTVIQQQQAIQGNPIILLTSEDPSVWEKFDVQKQPATARYTISSLDSDSQVQSLTLVFDNDHLQSLTMLDAQGQRSELSFSDSELNGNIQANLFMPSFPDTYIIDDQR